MPGYMTLDFEINISSDKKADKTGKEKRIKQRHSATHKHADADIRTIIYGDHPDRVKLLHSKRGFKRKLPWRVQQMLRQSHTIVGTNLKYDLSFIFYESYIQEYFLNGGKIWDIQLARYILSGQLHLYPSLAEMQKIYLGEKTKDDIISKCFARCLDADMFIKHRHKAKYLWQKYEHYSLHDGATPLYIMKKQYKEAMRLGVLPLIEMCNRYLVAITMMECNGIPVNTREAQKLYQELLFKQLDLLELASQKTRPYWDDKLGKFNIKSPKDLSLFLFGGKTEVTTKIDTGKVYSAKAKKAGQKIYKNKVEEIYVPGIGTSIRFTELNRTGYYSTRAEVIEKIAKNTKNPSAKEFCKLIVDARAYGQKISTYLRPFLYSSIDGRVHPNYNNCATATSRLSSSDPNAQNFPKHGDWGKIIQGLIVAPPGFVACQIDFSQLEVYCRALLSNDTNMIQDLIDGKDFHCQNVAWWKGVTYDYVVKKAKVEEDPEWKAYRSQAKPISFGEAYGQMEDSMADQTDIPLDTVKQIYESMKEQYPQIAAFDERVIDEVNSNQRLCKAYMLSSSAQAGTKDKNGITRRFHNGTELLPIRSRDRKTYSTKREEPRHIGTFRTPSKRIINFLEYGSTKKDGGVFRYFKPTMMKNYPMQSTAGDIQGITTAALLPYLLANKDIVQMINEIHDSKWFLIKLEHINTVIPRLLSIIESAADLFRKQFKAEVPVEFKADAEIGLNFADLETWRAEHDYIQKFNHSNTRSGCGNNQAQHAS